VLTGQTLEEDKEKKTPNQNDGRKAIKEVRESVERSKKAKKKQRMEREGRIQ